MSSISLVLLPYPHLGASARCFENRDLIQQTALAELVWYSLKRSDQQARHIALGAPPPPPLRPGQSERLVARDCMWIGYSLHLLTYVNTLKEECAARGFKTSPMEAIEGRMKEYVHPTPWFGDERVHFSHQALLLRKNPGFYGRYTWPILPTYPVLAPDSFVYSLSHWNRKRGQTKAFNFGVFSSA